MSFIKKFRKSRMGASSEKDFSVFGIYEISFLTGVKYNLYINIDMVIGDLIFLEIWKKLLKSVDIS